MINLNIFGRMFNNLFEVNIHNKDNPINNLDSENVFKMKEIFSFKGSDCFITAPILTIEKPTNTKLKQDVVLMDDVISINAIVDMISLHKKRISFSPTNIASPYTEIHLGGPIVNFLTNKYFSNDFQNINFKWHVKEKNYDIISKSFNLQYGNYVHKNNCENEWQGMVFDGKDYEYIEGRKDCSFLIKYSIKKEKTIHILGGCGSKGRIGAVNYFVNNFHKIYEEHGKKPYFKVAEVNIDNKGIPHTMKFDDLSYLIKKIK